MSFNKYMIFILTGVLLFVSSCTDLEEESYSNITSSQFEPTEKDLIRMIGPAYGDLTNVVQGWTNHWNMSMESSDQMVTPRRSDGWVDGGIYRVMHMHNWNSESPYMSGTWNNAYSGITKTNKAIYQIENGTIPIKKEEQKKSVLAEVRALRALYYWILLNDFGNVPIVTKFDVEPGFQPEQKSREEVYNFVESELTAVMDDLPVDHQKYYGRMHKWAAKALLLKLYINAEVYIGEPKWNKVINQANDIINSGRFVLDQDYKTTFHYNNTTMSNEIIFPVPQHQEKRGWFHLPWRTMNSINQSTYDLGSSPWGAGGLCAIPQFINTYEENDKRFDKTWLHGVQTSSAGDTLTWVPDDPDIEDPEEVPFEYVNRLKAIESVNAGNEGYRLKKYEPKMGAIYNIGNDWVFFRLTEIKMLKAEALLRQGNSGRAADIVTEIRQRAFEDPADAEVTANDLTEGSDYNYGVHEDNDGDNEMEFVTQQGGNDIQYGGFLDELSYELVGEAKRRTQLIRFGVYTTKSWFSHEADGSKHKQLMPIPQSALNSNPKLQQNPGY